MITLRIMLKYVYLHRHLNSERYEQNVLRRILRMKEYE